MKKIPTDEILRTRYGRLTPLAEANRIQLGGQKVRAFKCLCDCGNVKIIPLANLRKGDTKSCGCLLGEKLKEGVTTHGLSNHPLYGVHRAMISRCTNKNVKSYPYYGGRGIKICKEWADNFLTFYDFSIKSGWEHGLLIDRENNDGDYEPDNCRFVNRSVSNLNRRKLGTAKS